MHAVWFEYTSFCHFASVNTLNTQNLELVWSMGLGHTYALDFLVLVTNKDGEAVQHSSLYWLRFVFSIGRWVRGPP